jgi:hypothetical protein
MPHNGEFTYPPVGITRTLPAIMKVQAGGEKKPGK